MEPTPNEQRFIDTHKDAYALAPIKTTISVRSCSEFCGLDKIREPIAHQAALKAIGFETQAFIMPRSLAAQCPVQTMEIAEREFNKAVLAAEEAQRRDILAEADEAPAKKRSR